MYPREFRSEFPYTPKNSESKIRCTPENSVVNFPIPQRILRAKYGGPLENSVVLNGGVRILNAKAQYDPLFVKKTTGIVYLGKRCWGPDSDSSSGGTQTKAGLGLVAGMTS